MKGTSLMPGQVRMSVSQGAPTGGRGVELEVGGAPRAVKAGAYIEGSPRAAVAGAEVVESWAGGGPCHNGIK